MTSSGFFQEPLLTTLLRGDSAEAVAGTWPPPRAPEGPGRGCAPQMLCGAPPARRALESGPTAGRKGWSLPSECGRRWGPGKFKRITGPHGGAVIGDSTEHWRKGEETWGGGGEETSRRSSRSLKDPACLVHINNYSLLGPCYESGSLHVLFQSSRPISI